MLQGDLTSSEQKGPTTHPTGSIGHLGALAELVDMLHLLVKLCKINFPSLISATKTSFLYSELMELGLFAPKSTKTNPTLLQLCFGVFKPSSEPIKVFQCYLRVNECTVLQRMFHQ